MNDRSIMVCMRVADADPGTASEQRRCMDCDTPIWISIESLKIDADLICHPCAMEVPGIEEMPIQVPPEVRETLHRKGYTDEKINEVVEFAQVMFKRERQRRNN